MLRIKTTKTLIGLTACAATLIGGAIALVQIRAGSQPTSPLLSERGPTFKLDASKLAEPLSVITYGDMRFTDPKNVTATNPRVRKWLAEKIAAEHATAVLLNGDVPLAGDVTNDYAVFHRETKVWRDAGLHVYPALGNHEFRGCDPRECLENWWSEFPEMRNRRWYSAQIGPRIYTITLDSDTSLLPDSDQGRWLNQQLKDLPQSVDFVFLSLHHPPVADIQTHIEVDHNPRPNEIAVRDLLSKVSATLHARFIVSAGHIHNYERHLVDEVVYLVSGGGGARPYSVERTKDDLYQSNLFPNFHYVKFKLENDRLEAKMFRVGDLEKTTFTVEIKDQFEVKAKSRTAGHSGS